MYVNLLGAIEISFTELEHFIIQTVSVFNIFKSENIFRILSSIHMKTINHVTSLYSHHMLMK